MEEKKQISEIVERRDSGSEPMEFDSKATKRLLRRIDWYLIPFLSGLYLLSFLDRSNIGNARLANLERDLNMKGLDYNIALAVFFPFYVAAEIPSNLMMKATKPSIWIPTIMIAWSVCCICMGFVKSFGGLLAARSALGIAEGGLFPGVTYYITMWYRRHECGFRMAIFFSAATAAGAFGGLLARGIALLEGRGGLGAWSWIFIIEGIITFVVAGFAFWAMYDYPATAKFLNADQKREVQRRLELDQSSLANEFAIKYVWDALKDWKIYVNCLITIGIFTPLYSFSLFLPTIVKTLGYTNNQAQLMTVPPYVVACVFCIGAGWGADKQKQRCAYIVSFCFIGIVGFALLLTSENPKIKYLGTFFAASGIYPNVPQITAWTGNNIGGSTKRSVGMAMQVGVGNLGGVMSAFLFLSKDSPHFSSGHSILIGLLAMSSSVSVLMGLYLRRENARRDKLGKRPEDYTSEDRAAERAEGDNASFFRYTV